MSTNTPTETGSAPPPGWYVPPGEAVYRWWDGTRWTVHTSPLVAPPKPDPDPYAHHMRSAWFSLCLAAVSPFMYTLLSPIMPNTAWLWLVILVIGPVVAIVHLVKALRIRNARTRRLDQDGA